MPSKATGNTCGQCKHYPQNPIRNPARMEACGIHKIAVREGGKACPDFEDRGCKWRKLSAVNFALAQCPAYICTHPGIAKPAYCEEGDIPADCPAKEEKA